MGVEAMKVVRAYYNHSEAPGEYPHLLEGLLEGLLERAARLGAEADASAVEEYRWFLAEAWAKIGRLGLTEWDSGNASRGSSGKPEASPRRSAAGGAKRRRRWTRTPIRRSTPTSARPRVKRV